MGSPERARPSLQVFMIHTDGKTETIPGPEYRRRLLAGLPALRRAGSAPDLSDHDVRRRALSFLLAFDNAWSETHRPGYSVALVTVGPAEGP